MVVQSSGAILECIDQRTRVLHALARNERARAAVTMVGRVVARLGCDSLTLTRGGLQFDTRQCMRGVGLLGRQCDCPRLVSWPGRHSVSIGRVIVANVT